MAAAPAFRPDFVPPGVAGSRRVAANALTAKSRPPDDGVDRVPESTWRILLPMDTQRRFYRGRLHRSKLMSIVGIILAILVASLVATAPAEAEPATTSSTAACGGTAWAPPGGVWGPAKNSNCSVFGSPNYHITYIWTRKTGTGPVCVQGWGFPLKGGSGRWYSLGCGNLGQSKVPWGNVAATPKVRAYSLSLVGAFVSFAH